ncbi:MAG: glycoside hydrolase family 97 catalytic domain-containing protein [Breznakibacter sp.]
MKQPIFQTFRTKWLMLITALAVGALMITVEAQTKIASPDKKTHAYVTLNSNGVLHYSVSFNNETVLEPSRLGLMMEDNDFSKGLKLDEISKPKKIKESYELFTGKKSLINYDANEQTFVVSNGKGSKMEVIFRVSNNGVAFRYNFPGQAPGLKKVSDETTSFKFPAGSKGFLQPMSVAKTGWCETNNSYEEHYISDVTPGTESPLGVGWVYPALFKTGNYWLLISETALGRNYCGTRLVPGIDGNDYKVGFPDPREVFTNGVAFPESSLPWATPWRVMAVGSLAQITESTIGTDLAEPSKLADTSWIRPGIASWSWIILKDESVNYDETKRYIDFASDMKWGYCLVDADWDRRIGHDRVKELADYAKTKNVKLILWYNSSGDWNSTKYSPKSQLLTHEARQKEFERIHKMGIAGVKVDFFGGDGQSMIAYYHDILDDAAKYQLNVNFHGATLPRGWHRTYPHLVTTEAIKGYEFVTFGQADADKEPSHFTMAPFTRNVFDPMDITPMNLTEIPNITRRTSGAFELASTVVFTSGVQHMAETPKGMARVPVFVKSFLQTLPVRWDASKLVGGDPGKWVAMARRAGNIWYIGGMNGEALAKKATIDLSFIKKGSSVYLIEDGKEPNTFTERSLDFKNNKLLELDVKPNGGFVVVVK